METFDVLIVGAGLSGIGAAVHLRKDCPDLSFAIVEARSAIGGTWDLFRYPGIRSDSDMHTLGYVFKPWTKAKAIADGPSIRDYVNETADEHDLRRHIRFDRRVVRSEWSSTDALWTVTIDHGGQEERLRCRFLYMNSGYYDYDRGYRPEFPGEEEFAGQFVHPQHWPEDLDYAGKRVVIIGSGATAVTLVPELAKEAAHVTMLQRSPTWMVSRPAEDRIANLLRRWLPEMLAYRLTRFKNVRLGSFFFKRARSQPKKVGDRLLSMAREHLGPEFDIDTHLTPRYNPWEQRLCLIPDADMFQALKRGDAEIVTDHIERFTAGGILLKSGRELPADIVVTATGLNLKMLGGMEMVVDGRTIGPKDTYPYKGVMYAGVPNLAATFGYTNASWTLKADITATYVCRLLNLMKARGVAVATPQMPQGDFEEAPFSNLSSGYFERAEHLVPKSTTKAPWQQPHDYLNDRKDLMKGVVDDGTLLFSNADETTGADTAAKGADFAVAAE
ncbi:flavin-containing monooxygenase [Pacificimonas flava]|uniref:Monooxygenase, flavin-binding family n=1 Tax=Pacificimonas flava TaxID=1234595 RepID=M2TA03_9SPHN|nr:NAD(P)/FAD-dependent oxidoreductase [Pacificimonas flava]EMD83404.1 monooxygenase, flavin-binding family [Pacificimonas flava]MBB5279034.1 cation diffusion facilitator CzcD-associated flavoprotein CzcO [Pacificimonas flava]